MKKRYYLGIDLAKVSFEFCLLRGNRSCLWRGKFNNEPTQIERFLEQLSARVQYKLLSVHFAMEATGVYGKRLVAALHQRQLTVSVLNPAGQILCSVGAAQNQERSSRCWCDCPLLLGA